MSDENRIALEKVAKGLGLIYAGLVIIVLAIIGGFIVGFAVAGQAAAGGGIAGNETMGVALLAIIGVSLVGTILDIVGRILCLSVPDKTRAATVIQVSVVCTILGLLLNLAGQFTQNKALTSISSLLSLVGAVVFMIFLMRLGRFLGRRDLADQGKTILTGSVILVGGFIGGAVAIGLGNLMLGGLLMIVSSFGFLILFVMYANLISSLKQATAQQARGMALE